VSEAPVPEAPRPEAPRPEPARPEAAKREAAKGEPAAPEAARAEAPRRDAPHHDAPHRDAPHHEAQHPEAAPAADPPRASFWSSKALSSEWGLRGLALILAILVWTVGRQGISTVERLRVFVETVPVSPDVFAAYHVGPSGGGRIEIDLRGTRGQIEEARKIIDRDPRIRLYIPDLRAGLDTEDRTYTWRNDGGRFAFGFSKDLVDGLDDVPVKVFRKADQRVRVATPGFDGVPAGYEIRDIKVDPPEFSVTAPVGMFGGELQPDLVDVRPAFDRGDAQKGTFSGTLSFETWRKEEGQERWRSAISLPSVTVTARVVAVESRKINNALTFPLYSGVKGDSAGDYIWTLQRASIAEMDATQMRFTGEFTGGKADLDLLEQHLGEWTYGLLVPVDSMREFLASGAKTTTFSAALTWLPATDALRHLAVHFVPPTGFPSMTVTVTKSE
jgi:hypothetical protein